MQSVGASAKTLNQFYDHVCHVSHRQAVFFRLAVGIILEEFMMDRVQTLRNAPESPSWRRRTMIVTKPMTWERLLKRMNSLSCMQIPGASSRVCGNFGVTDFSEFF